MPLSRHVVVGGVENGRERRSRSRCLSLNLAASRGGQFRKTENVPNLSLYNLYIAAGDSEGSITGLNVIANTSCGRGVASDVTRLLLLPDCNNATLEFRSCFTRYPRICVS